MDVKKLGIPLVVAAVIAVLGYVFYLERSREQSPSTSDEQGESVDASAGATWPTQTEPSAVTADGVRTIEPTAKVKPIAIAGDASKSTPKFSPKKLDEILKDYKPSDFQVRIEKAKKLKAFSFEQMGNCTGLYQAQVTLRSGKKAVLKASLSAGYENESFYTEDCVYMYESDRPIFTARMKDEGIEVFEMPEGNCAITARKSMTIEIIQDRPRRNTTAGSLAVYHTQDGKFRHMGTFKTTPFPDGKPFADFCMNSKIQR